MGLSTLCFLLGAIGATIALQWSEDNIAVMAQYSTDHYNKVSGEDVIYGLQENRTEYIMDEKSSFHQLSFPIQETLCQKSNNVLNDGCPFKEGGVVKSCTSNFFEEDDKHIIVVTCENHHEHSRVRRSRGSGGGRGGGRGSGGRGGNRGGSRGGKGNGGRGRSGAGSFIAGGSIGGNRGGSRYA